MLAVFFLLLGKEIALPAILHNALSSDPDVHALAFPLTALILLGIGLVLGALGSGAHAAPLPPGLSEHAPLRALRVSAAPSSGRPERPSDRRPVRGAHTVTPPTHGRSSIGAAETVPRVQRRREKPETSPSAGDARTAWRPSCRVCPNVGCSDDGCLRRTDGCKAPARRRRGRAAREALRRRAVLHARRADRARHEGARRPAARRPRRRPAGPRAARASSGGSAPRSGSRTCSRRCSSSRARAVEFEPYTLPEPSLDGRVDLRELTTFTIDPETAKDFDDALSFRREPDGIRAWVHIADVSYFVPAGCPLDRGAAAARVLDLRAGPRRADAAARARRRRLLAAAAPGPALRHGRDAARRRAALLPLGDPLGRAAHLRPGASAARRRRRSSSSSTLAGEVATALRGAAVRPRRARDHDARDRRSTSPTAASPTRGSRASRTRTCSSRS